jgi:multiple sugar transport system substrate-binding protein
MFPQGNWFVRLLNSQKDYPRSWKYGVTQLPSTGADGNNNLVSQAYVSINKNAAHPKEALTYMLWIAQNQWRYEGGIPALATLTPEQQNAAFSAVASASDGQVTVSNLYDAMLDNGMGVVDSDIVGTAATEYNNIVKEEVSSFCMDLQSLEDTIAHIVSRVNDAIKSAR